MRATNSAAILSYSTKRSNSSARLWRCSLQVTLSEQSAAETSEPPFTRATNSAAILSYSTKQSSSNARLWLCDLLDIPSEQTAAGTSESHFAHATGSVATSLYLIRQLSSTARPWLAPSGSSWSSTRLHKPRQLTSRAIRTVWGASFPR
jgi:hypothetical protein